MAEPSARRGHVAAGVEGKVYVWGGLRGKISHDGPDKAEIIFIVDILDVKVSRTGVYVKLRQQYITLLASDHHC